jgi:hypothetical protein
MTSSCLTYEQILVTNNLLRTAGDETYFLGVTRTVQESKFFPVSAYILLGYFNSFYRYPTLLRKIERHMSAEDLADRVRNSNSKCQSAVVNWCLPNFYLLGREMLINMGFIRPHDAAGDVFYVMDFWRRFNLAFRREDRHITCKEGGHRSQLLPERRVQVFHADLYPCEQGAALHAAADKFIAAASQYAVLAACESRVCMNNHGPYNLGGGKELLVRDFYDLAEGDMPWLDGIAEEVPHARLTVTTAVKDTHFYIVDDWGSFESKPEYRSSNLCGIGLYTSDELSETHIPVGMGSKEELTETLERYAEIFRRTTAKLWQRFAGYSRDQLLDAGALTYFAVIKDFAHVAGCYDAEDWNEIDERAERFRVLLNDEYGNQMMGSHFVALDCPSHQCNEYTMMHHSDLPTRSYSPLSMSLLQETDYVPTVGDGICPGVTYLPEKIDRYRTTQGVMGLAELNRRTREFVPQLSSDKFRYLDDTWVQYHYDTPLANELYCIDQQYSRKLAGKGSRLTRDDIERLADKL